MTEQKDNKLVPTAKPTEKPKFRVGVKPIGLAAARAKAATAIAKEGAKVIPGPAKMEDAIHKIGIVFDDSGSMNGQPILDAQEGTEEFIRNCNPTNTALSVYPMNMDTEDDGSDIWHTNYGHKKVDLTTDLISVAKVVKTYKDTGGTPLYSTTVKMLREQPLTRGIVFSDGSPNSDSNSKEEMFDLAKEKKIPIDAVYIGSATDSYAVRLMQEIAERTGGVFLIFERGKVNFRTAFKYLTPGYRALLMDKSFAEKLQRGEVK